MRLALYNTEKIQHYSHVIDPFIYFDNGHDNLHNVFYVKHTVRRIKLMCRA